jgi:pyruvate/2-oxoglutarate dehydrogenase complex dihydrolipoamide dehydrogenase (E3) component
MAKANTRAATYGAIIIGAGQAGPPLARRLAAAA